jgi:uncharacterized protein (UPF0332 family)
MIVTPETFMEKAERALSSAQLLLDSGDNEGACNRAYYSMFDAASAALLFNSAAGSGNLPNKHANLIASFGLELVKTGRISAEARAQ